MKTDIDDVNKILSAIREPAKPDSLERVVSCVQCRHCGPHNGAQVRCTYPRERQPEVVDMTTMSGWTMASAAEICLKYEAANGEDEA